jgi:uncharacterized protein (DUF58 family)
MNPARATAARAGAPLFDEAFLKKLEYLAVVSRKLFAGRLRAERRSRKTGAGVEFADHRDYTIGDDLRYLDWGVYGRLGRLLVRLFEEEEDLHVYLLLDASASMATGAPPKFDYARQVVAALAYVALANLDRISIVPLRAGARERGDAGLPPARGKGRIFKVFDLLGGLAPSGTTDLTQAVSAFVHRAPRRGVAVLVSDFYDPAGFEGALNLLRFHRFESFALQVLDPKEAAPELLGDLEIVDCETGDAREVTVSPRVLADFRRAHEELCGQLSAWCSSRGVPYLRVETSTPFEDLVLRLFREGGLVR